MTILLDFSMMARVCLGYYTKERKNRNIEHLISIEGEFAVGMWCGPH